MKWRQTCRSIGRILDRRIFTFIYRLAGRDRQKSASYYTPQVLTRCLVKYALKELLKGKTADELLTLFGEYDLGSAEWILEMLPPEIRFRFKHPAVAQTDFLQGNDGG